MNTGGDILATIGGIVKVLLFLTLIIVFVPIALFYNRFAPDRAFVLPLVFHKYLLRILGMHYRVIGQMATERPVLFVANHASYLDVPVLGALLPASFVAKSEVSGWPLFGFLSRLQNTIFIERRAARAALQRTQLEKHLAQGKNIVLFPEGTSSDGLEALPFKSSLFSIVEDSSGDRPVTVQPISLTCTLLDGTPLRREQRALYAWYGDMTLPGHLWNVFKRGHFTVEVIFHPPLTITKDGNRKQLAAACQERVARGIEASLAGRGAVPEMPLAAAKE